MSQGASTESIIAEDIRLAMARILASKGLLRSRRLQALLEYLVEESLAGRGDKIKATTVAIEVYGRDETFDQQADPIVRVEAGRLRQRLAEYYREEGRADPLLIEIPKGGYRPVFSPRDVTEPALAAGELGEPLPVQETGKVRDQRFAAIAAVIVSLLVATWVVLYFLHSADEQGTLAPAIISGDKPYIAVMPVVSSAMDEESTRLATGLVEALITNLSKVSGLSVMAHASVLEAQYGQRTYGIHHLRSEFGVTHLLRGTMERQDDEVLLYVQLVDAKNAQVLWAERMSRRIGQAHNPREALATAIAKELTVQLQPEEQARLSQSHTTSPEAWLLYRQGLIAIMPPRDLARVMTARKLFASTVEVAPDFAGGYAGQSFSHSTRVLFMNADDPVEELATAVEFAGQAIARDPDFGAGYAMLAFAQVLAGDSQAALANVRTALEIQPGDAFARFVMGMSLMLSGQPAVAIPHLQEALRLDPLEPRMPYLNLLGIAYYGAGDFSAALGTFEENYARGGPRGPHVDVFIAAAMAQLGEDDDARVVINSMREKYSGFPFSAWLERWIKDSQLRADSMAGLQSLGLPFK